MAKKLLHFTSADNAIAILESREFRPSKIQTCNDPFDIDINPCSIYFKDDNKLRWFCDQLVTLYENNNPFFNSEISQIIKAQLKNGHHAIAKKLFEYHKKKIDNQIFSCENLPAFENLNANAHIYCFSESDVKSNVLMWSHYGKKHSGIALTFHFSSPEISDILHKVQYNRQNIRSGCFSPTEIINLFKKCMTDGETKLRIFEKTLLTKHYDWRYEKEWRIISSSMGATKPIFLDINDHIISDIYFGVNIETSDKENLLAVIKRGYPNTKCHILRKNKKFIKYDTELL